MRVYTCKELLGRWPVGTAAVVVANDRGHAKSLLEAKAKEHGLLGTTDLKGTPLKLDDFIEVNITSANAVLLLDGDY